MTTEEINLMVYLMTHAITGVKRRILSDDDGDDGDEGDDDGNDDDCSPEDEADDGADGELSWTAARPGALLESLATLVLMNEDDFL